MINVKNINNIYILLIILYILYAMFYIQCIAVLYMMCCIDACVLILMPFTTFALTCSEKPLFTVSKQ